MMMVRFVWRKMGGGERAGRSISIEAAHLFVLAFAFELPFPALEVLDEQIFSAEFSPVAIVVDALP